MGKRVKIGVDEVGRGCLAGPVVVAAVLIPDEKAFKRAFLKAKMPELRDSKKMTPKNREKWFLWIKKSGAEKCGVVWSFSKSFPGTIDRINISASANRAAYSVVLKVFPDTGYVSIRLDGGLYLKNRNFQNHDFSKKIKRSAHTGKMTVITAPKSDNSAIEVMLASVMAKVHRDRIMERLHKIHPDYGFNKNKGYGTKKHIEALVKNGLILGVHRETFIRNPRFGIKSPAGERR